jgi:hypothetical protein
MRSRRIIALCAALASVVGGFPATAGAQANAPPPPPQVEPGTPEPGTLPAPPPPPPSAAQAAPQPQAQGQWVYTRQYGWVWMNYDDSFTYVPPDGTGEPMEYVYYPTVGWTWVVAPWVWGIGPWPYFGVRGPLRFAWYGHGWWRTPARWHFRPAPARGALAVRGIRPAPFRGARRSAHEVGSRHASHEAGRHR